MPSSSATLFYRNASSSSTAPDEFSDGEIDWEAAATEADALEKAAQEVQAAAGELVGCDYCARVFHNTKKCWVSHGAVDPRGRVACRHCWGAAILKAKAKAHEAALDCSPGPAAKATNTLCTQHKTCVSKTKTNEQ